MNELVLLKNKLEEELRTSRTFLQQKKESLDALRYDVHYYEGQIDALNQVRTIFENIIKEKGD